MKPNDSVPENVRGKENGRKGLRREKKKGLKVVDVEVKWREENGLYLKSEGEGEERERLLLSRDLSKLQTSKTIKKKKKGERISCSYVIKNG